LCAIPIAFISLLDDIYVLSYKLRFIVQSLSTLMALYCLGGVNHIDFIFFDLDGSWVNIIAFFIIVWLTNLYNFLDGIDGYAGSQALVVGLGLSFFLGNVLGLLLVSISLGFLVFNWDKASIFMGDVGSATLGFIFAIFALSDTSNGNIYLWLVMLSLFWFDATITLFRRYLNHESITQAHNKHAYQRLVQSGWSHNKVVFYALCFNLLFLFLLYIIKYIWIVFILNILSLVLIMRFIGTQKSFK
jgi:Fuc2NAc and GlcNAc transferase